MSRNLSAEPHHDGSALYTGAGPSGLSGAALGDVVPVRVRVPRLADGSGAADTVVLRSVRDGEPLVTPARRDGSDDGGEWWCADLPLLNPLTSYRFLVTGAGAAYRWLNAAGNHERDVTDAGDFKISTEHRLPDWVADQVGYQVFPDRFAPTDTGAPLPTWASKADWDDPVIHQGAGVERQLYGGTLDGVVDHLDHLDDLGASLLYLTPFFPARSNHRYDAISFDHVDPLLGGDDALGRLLDAARARQLRVVGDLTTNHTGDAHDWFVRALADPSSVERGFYRIADDGSYAAWLDIPSLPKLDHSSAELARRLYRGPESVVGRWLQRGLAGWRIDVANMTGRLGADDHAHAVAGALRTTLAEIDPEAWLLAEHGHDATLDLLGAGWHGTMDYAGFTRPAWAWLNDGGPGGAGITHGLNWLGLPVGVPSLGADTVVGTMREVHAAMPWASWMSSTMHLDSHDTPRFRTVTGGGVDGWIDAAGRGRDRHLLGVAMQFTMPGVPVVFMGDELGLTGVDGEHARTPFPWHRRDEWDAETFSAYRTWIGRRRHHVALRRGSMRWVHADAESMTFLREHPDETLLVRLVRSGTAPLRLARAPAGARSVTWLDGAEIAGDPDHVTLPGDGPAAYIARLD